MSSKTMKDLVKKTEITQLQKNENETSQSAKYFKSAFVSGIKKSVCLWELKHIHFGCFQLWIGDGGTFYRPKFNIIKCSISNSVMRALHHTKMAKGKHRTSPSRQGFSFPRPLLIKGIQFTGAIGRHVVCPTRPAPNFRPPPPPFEIPVSPLLQSAEWDGWWNK